MFSKLFNCLKRVKPFSVPDKDDEDMPSPAVTDQSSQPQGNPQEELSRTAVFRQILKLRRRTKAERALHCEKRHLKKFLRQHNVCVCGMTVEEMREAKRLLLEPVNGPTTHFCLDGCCCRADPKNLVRDKNKQESFDEIVLTTPVTESESGKGSYEINVKRDTLKKVNGALENLLANDQRYDDQVLQMIDSTASTVTVSSNDSIQSQSMEEQLTGMDKCGSILRASAICNSQEPTLHKSPTKTITERSRIRQIALSSEYPGPPLKGNDQLDKEANKSDNITATTTISINCDIQQIATKRKFRTYDKFRLQPLEETEESFDETTPDEPVERKQRSGERKLNIDKTGKLTPEELEENNKLHLEVLKWFESQEEILSFLTGSDDTYVSIEQPEP